MNTNLTFTVTDAPSIADSQAIIDGLVAYNDSAYQVLDKKPISVFVRRENEIVAGAEGTTLWKWLNISRLWVHEGLRGSGLGSTLMQCIEDAAKERGCIGSCLDTFSFQALPFYEKLGYTLFGTIPDWPPGQARHYLYKRFM